MPANKKVTREMILNAAMDVFRKEGFEAVNARSVAKEMNCSTQPIYVEFNSMDEIKKIIKDEALELHAKKINDALSKSDGKAYLAYGMGFVEFARTEKMLFKFFYLGSDNIEKEIDYIHYEDIISTIQREYGYTRENAVKFHRDMSIFSLGLSIMLYLGKNSMSTEEIMSRLDSEFRALTAVYGKPARYPHPEEHIND